MGSIQFDVDNRSTPDTELERFLEREWEFWHEETGSAAVDWSRSSVRVVARDGGGEIVGAAVGRMRAGVGHLSELMVARAARRGGLGTELVRRFDEHCAASGCHKLTVHTELDGPAHAFYLRNGWLREAVFRRDRGGQDFVRLYKFLLEDSTGE